MRLDVGGGCGGRDGGWRGYDLWGGEREGRGDGCRWRSRCWRSRERRRRCGWCGMGRTGVHIGREMRGEGELGEMGELGGEGWWRRGRRGGSIRGSSARSRISRKYFSVDKGNVERRAEVSSARNFRPRERVLASERKSRRRRWPKDEKEAAVGGRAAESTRVERQG